MTETEKKTGWLARLRQGLGRSSAKMTEGLTAVLTKRKLDDADLDQLEEGLIAADIGPATASRIRLAFAKNRFGKDVDNGEIKTALAEHIAELLRPIAQPLALDRTRKPFVILVVGVNGTGKTTTIGKLAQNYNDNGLKVMLAAGDTFRAAAISQLKIWGERAGVGVVAGTQGGDAAALAFQAVERARASACDVLLIDTAGRLHNKKDLMQELAKIVRVLQKTDPTAPHATILTLDATTGQNAHAQVEAFKEITPITGLVVTKLDGSAKGGVVVGLADRFHLPIYAIGVGEKAEDLQAFDADDFAKALVGLE